jgi:transposase-like protein
LSDGTGHLQCPFCNSYEVERLYLASLRLDSCACQSCGASWDEDPVTGAYRGRASRSSVVTPRDQ